MGQSNCQKMPKRAKMCFPFYVQLGSYWVKLNHDQWSWCGQIVLADWAKSRQNDKRSPNWQKFTKVAKSPQIRLQVVSRGFWWFQVSNSMSSDDSGDLRVGTLRVRGARSGPEGPWASWWKIDLCMHSYSAEFTIVYQDFKKWIFWVGCLTLHWGRVAETPSITRLVEKWPHKIFTLSGTVHSS